MAQFPHKLLDSANRIELTEKHHTLNEVATFVQFLFYLKALISLGFNAVNKCAGDVQNPDRIEIEIRVRAERLLLTGVRRCHMTSWQVQDAKARFSEFLEASLKHGPQVVTRRGVETAGLVPIQE